MATKTATKIAPAEKITITSKPLARTRLSLTLVSTSPLLVSKLGDIKDTTKRSNEDMFKLATYQTDASTAAKPAYGLPANAFKRAIENAAIYLKEKALYGRDFWKGAIRIVSADRSGIVPFRKCAVPLMEVKQVRNKSEQVVPSVRARFDWWEIELVIEFNATVLTPDIIVNQLVYAGFHIGVGVHRPECGGGSGTFDAKLG